MPELKPNERLEAVLKSLPEALRGHYKALIDGGGENVPLPKFHTLESLSEQLQHLPKIETHSTGFTELDKITAGGIQEGEVILLAAMYGSGKTHFAVNLAINYAKQGLPVCYLTMEDGWKLVLKRFQLMDIEKATPNNVFMVHENELTIDNSAKVIEAAKIDAKLIIVDNLFALPLRQNTKGDYWTSQAEWVDDISNIIRGCGCSCLILHHLNKNVNGGQGAGGYQIAGSTRIMNRVAQVWLMYRNDNEPNILGIKIEKNRNCPTKGECFLKSDALGLLESVRSGTINPKLEKHVREVFKVDR